jgi:hypothetical protein
VQEETSNSSDVTVEEVKSNVIPFPKPHKNFALAASLQEMMEQATKNKIEFVSFLSGEVTEELFYKLSIMGFTFDDETFNKDLVLVMEAVRSIMLKSLGISHGLQLAAEKLIDIPDSFYDAEEEFDDE